MPLDSDRLLDEREAALLELMGGVVLANGEQVSLKARCAMKVKAWVPFLLFVVFLFLVAWPLPTPVAAKDKKKADSGKDDRPRLSKKERERRRRSLEKELNRPFEKWLKEDVAYIITSEERASFKRLQNAEEREQFIEQFWIRRDPTPDTAENEYREEMYRRVAYANEHFGSGVPGWKTDRGRIYITFGPPDQREMHPTGGQYRRPFELGGGSSTAYPWEKWRYRYIEGMDPNVEIEFVDKFQTGEYRMAFGPEEKNVMAGNIPGSGLSSLHQMGPNQGELMREGESGLGGSYKYSRFRLLEQYAKLQKPPPVKFRDLEAVVSSKINYNVFPFQVRTDYVRITSDITLAALTVQVNFKDMTFENEEGIERGTVNVFGRVSTLSGRVVQTFEDVVSVDVPADQFEQYLDQKRVYWQGLPLRFGLYRLDLVLKDIKSGNMGTHRMALRVPRYDEETLSASSLILADRLGKVSTRQIGKGMFVIGSTKVRPSVEEKFRRNQRLGIYLEIYNLATDEQTRRPSASIEYALQKNGQTLFQVTENSDQIKGAYQRMTLEKMIPLESLEPGQYKLQVKVTDRINKRSIAPTATFTVE